MREESGKDQVLNHLLMVDFSYLAEQELLHSVHAWLGKLSSTILTMCVCVCVCVCGGGQYHALFLGAGKAFHGVNYMNPLHLLSKTDFCTHLFSYLLTRIK